MSLVLISKVTIFNKHFKLNENLLVFYKNISEININNLTNIDKKLFNCLIK